MMMFTPQEEKNLLACAFNQKEVSSLAWLYGFIYGLAIIPAPFKANELIPGAFPEEMRGIYRPEDMELMAVSLTSAYSCWN